MHSLTSLSRTRELQRPTVCSCTILPSFNTHFAIAITSRTKLNECALTRLPRTPDAHPGRVRGHPARAYKHYSTRNHFPNRSHNVILCYNASMSDTKNETPLSETQIVSAAMRLLGSRRSPHKTETARRNGRMKRLKPLSDIPCNCPAGHGCPTGHRTYCLYGRALSRRQPALPPAETP